MHHLSWNRPDLSIRPLALRYGMKTAVAKEASIDSLVELVIKLKGQREKNQAKIESDRRKEEEQSWI